MIDQFELHLQKIQYDEAVKGLKNRKDLTMDQAVTALDFYCSSLLQSLLLHNEESIQQQSVDSGWFLYQASLGEEKQTVRLKIRSTDDQPTKEIEVVSMEHVSEDPKEQGHRLILRKNEIIPGKYHENFPEVSIPLKDIASGIQPDGEWVSHTEDGVTSFKQYPWQARDHLGNLLIETSPRFMTQTERRYAEKKKGIIGYALFWNGQYENKEPVPVWNHRFAPDYFKQVRNYAGILRSIIFGADKSN